MAKDKALKVREGVWEGRHGQALTFRHNMRYWYCYFSCLLWQTICVTKIVTQISTVL